MADREMPDPEGTYRLIGHQAAEVFLERAWRSGKLAHAWLITGAERIGKATLAFRFARAILSGALDEQGALSLPGLADDAPLPNVDPDQIDARQIAAGSHSNLFVIRRSLHPLTGKLRNEIVVDDVRDATQFLRTTAMNGGWRIVIVDPIDDMNRSAANALLKSLEEPPHNCLFLLINHVPGSILPTIRSRCQVLFLSTLTEQEMQIVLQDVPDLGNDADTDLLISLSDGSPGKALEHFSVEAPKLDRQLTAILSVPEDASRLKALDLAEQVSRTTATDAYRTVGLLLGRRCAIAAREADTANVREAAAGAWFSIGESFRVAESLNLDRRQTVLAACQQVRSVTSANQS